ncbi:MAG: hypothetical protein MK102_12110 [Fuerstiella sp.]|nr:hypothetical protein [Fuerstiella sp.]
MSVESRSPIRQLICSTWIVGFLVVFFSQDLENNRISRSDIWNEIWNGAIVIVPSLLNPFDVSHVSAFDVDSGWHLLAQRLPFFLIAVAVFLAAMATGMAITRVLLSSSVLTPCERFVIQAGLGLSAQSLWTLMIGSWGWLSTGTLMTPAVVSILFLSIDSILRRRRAADVLYDSSGRPSFEAAPRWVWMAAGLAILPFLILILLNGFTPPWEFDSREYHLQGPKEWFQAGRITFLEHNVYTSFPFLSEMLSLDAMVVTGDWNDGAISAKAVLAGFQLLTTMCVFATGQRWFGTTAGLIAAIVYISVPWTLRISIVAYAEGAATCFLMVTLMCGLIISSTSDPSVQRRLTLVTGLLAGSAMAAKYPGIVSVVIPVGLLLFWSVRRQRRVLLSTILLFCTGVLLTTGPWLVRNAVNTGNPVYPLLYSMFGAEDWSPEMDAKWKNAHSASEHLPAKIPGYLWSVLALNDWTSALLFGLAVPTVLILRKHRPSRWLWLMVVWMLVTWWALTHRIDRFWIPVIPVTAVLAGASWTMFSNMSWRCLLMLCVISCSLFNLQIWRSGLPGRQVGLIDLPAARRLPIRADFRLLNSRLSQQDHILMIGEAEVFDLQIPAFYNTVFDESLFEQWTADESDDRYWSRERRMRPPNEVHQVFRRKGVTHVYVNWLEILRYRGHGNYGYTEYVTPARLKTLEEGGVLSSPTDLTHGLWNNLQKQEQDNISDWPGSEDLLTTDSENVPEYWAPIRIYEVGQ